MSLDPPAYILSLQNNIRARPISWEGAVRAKTITDADLKKIKAIDKVRKEQRKQTVEAELKTYTALLLGHGATKSIFEGAAKRTDILQYMLVLTGDLVEDIPALTDALIAHPHPYAPLLPLLKQSNNAEDPIPLLASAVLAALLARALVAHPKSTPAIDAALPKLYTYIAALAATADSNLQDIAVQEYSALLRTSKSRQQFWRQRTETLTPLVEVLRQATGGRDSESTLYNAAGSSAASSIRTAAEGSSSSNQLGGGVGLQLLYHVLMALWQLSFEGRLVGAGLDEEHDIIPLYAQLLRVSPKEKTTRLLLGTLYNLLSFNQATLMPAALAANLGTVLANLKTRHLNDEDLLEDLDKLTTMMGEYTSSRTTLATYAAELSTGHLRWSPPHKNTQFWQDNALAIISQDNGALLKQLAEILAKSWDADKQVLAIGCSDVAALVKACPEKRAVLETFGLKGRVMGLMQDGDEGVRWESLRAVGEWLRYNVGGGE
ncbi:hypothetical protein LTR08_008921 [Meristemomyces frigidus]|nr:hypothetical protein LTR08_008921 [Meristemomyces frigidus]